MTTKKTTKSTAGAKRATAKANAPAPANGKPKKLSQIDAAAEVLKSAAEPMSCKQMVEAMAQRKLWASPGGKTPDQTLYASILREIGAKGKDARFVKAAPGRFAARG